MLFYLIPNEAVSPLHKDCALICLFIFLVLEFELRVSCLLARQVFYHLSHFTSSVLILN
jgi:hypothetical protein